MKRLIVIPLVLVFSLLAAASAAAGPPDVDTGSFTRVSEPIPGLCPDFPVYLSEVGTYHQTHFYDNQGNPVRILSRYAGTHKWYNGNDDTKQLSGPFNVIIDRDLRTGEETWQGLSNGVTAPGCGTVLMVAGRFFEYPDGRVVGKFSPADPTDREQLCELLASD